MEITRSIVSGDTLKIPIICVQDNTEETPVNITGWTFFFTLKKNKYDSDENAKISKAITDHDDAVNGKTTIIVPNTDTIELLGEYYFDIQIKYDSGEIFTPVFGVYEFTENLTVRTA